MSEPKTTRKRSQQGQAILETTLMAPFIFLLFIGIFDFGFYSYAFICTANAARVGALATSNDLATAGDAQVACTAALGEMQGLPNVGTGVTSCSNGGYQSGGSTIFQFTATSTTSPDGDTTNCSLTGAAPTGSKVQVAYNTIQLFPLPWLAGKLNITRTAWMRVKTC